MPDSALFITQQALELSRTSNNVEKISDCYFTLSKIYYFIHEYEKAYLMSTYYSSIKDSLTKTSYIKSIEQSQSMNNDILVLKQENDFKSKESKLLITIIILIIAIALGFFNRLLFSRKKNKELTVAYNKLSESEKNLSESDAKKTYYLDIINADIKQASEYVMSILPYPLKSGYVDIIWKFIPSVQLGGDDFFYNKFNDCLVFYLIDVSGHGIGSALHAISVLSHINNQISNGNEHISPAKILGNLHDNFPMFEYNDLFFTIWYGIYYFADKTLKFATGGHHPAILIDSAGNSTMLVTDNPFIGLPQKVNFFEKEIIIPENSFLYLFSDGVYEVPKEDGKIQSFDEFSKFLIENASHIIDDIDIFYQKAIKMRKADSLADDFSILRLNFK